MGTAARSDLQAVFNAGRSGNKIIISGVCAGNYMIAKTLTLEGLATTSVPTPTLDGNQAGSVVTIVTDGIVRIKKLTIQNGRALNGGGIESSSGNIILNATTVQWNTASDNGGGVHISEGPTLTLNNGSRVVNNTSGVDGGGIYTDGGVVTLNGNARVASNVSREGGGIYTAEGNVWLRGTSSVRGNEATAGGGIYSDVGDIHMDGSSIVTGNQASAGGGIYGWDWVLLAGSASVIHNTATGRGAGGGIHMWTEACDASSPFPWVGAISPNSPDDPPEVTYVAC